MFFVQILILFAEMTFIAYNQSSKRILKVTSMSLKFAHLSFGSGLILVKSSDACPLPAEFDFSDPEECARTIFAIMSCQSGGFTLRDCKLAYDPERRSANLTCGGMHVYYQDDAVPEMTGEQAVAYAGNYPGLVRHLGNVRSEGYGDGWKRAQWSYIQRVALVG
jgi:hypothetical protein